ncbi:phosphatidylserine/phosphatidylglycerophosphate/cardiolipin synthase family protein [bacterium]|nr:phosphatidylserine/phosphatidylglycerophosphate/cardiolipin synthase family protein [bacterium]
MSNITDRAISYGKSLIDSLKGTDKPKAKEAPKEAPKGPRMPLDKLLLSNATRHNEVTYHVGAEDSFQAILSALKGAKTSFHIETFIWHDDETGRKLAQALVAKVKEAKAQGRTFDAKVLIDSTGINSDYGTKDRNILKFLQDNGVEAKLFNPKLVSWKAEGMLPLTHRKIYIADGAKYLVGGRNVGDEYFKPTFEKKAGDPKSKANSHHDFLMTVEGDEAARVQKEFYKAWALTGGKVPATDPKPIPSKTGDTAIQTFVTDPLTGNKGLKEVHLKAIANAQKEIFIISPYFADDELVDALIDAKQKNPKLSVKALVPASGEGGKDLNYQMAMLTAKQLLEAGIEVRLSAGGVDKGKPVERFSHFKGMTVDGEILSIGSANADYRTYNTNHEIVNIVADKEKVAEFNRTIANPDWNAAQPISMKWLKDNSTWAEKAFRTVAEPIDFLY